MDGGAGNDILESGMANDTMTGGADADMFVFYTGFGQDVITDFTASIDERIVLAGVDGITDFDDLVTNHLEQVGADVVITATAEDTITLKDVAIEDLYPVNFVF